MSAQYDFVIVGAGILGTAIAALAANDGYRALVLRMPDSLSPSADTLRNQGWLQSGLIYRLEDFTDEDAYRDLATKTYFAGDQLLDMCGLPVSGDSGIVGTSSDNQRAKLKTKAKLLNLRQDEFRRLEPDEIEKVLGPFAEADRVYYAIPDKPFDEAGVLRQLRRQATQGGAVFLEVLEPVALRPEGAQVRVCWDGTDVVTPLAIVTAGAGSFDLVAQAGGRLDGILRRTPLLRTEAPDSMPAGIMIDLGHGYSAVRHSCEDRPNGAVVIGTRSNLEPAEFARPWERRIPTDECAKFHACIPASFKDVVRRGLFTAGYEVIPTTRNLTPYDAWIESLGPVIFASPGRATISLLAANDVLDLVRSTIRSGSPKVSLMNLSSHAIWSDEISMHYTPRYAFNDAEA